MKYWVLLLMALIGVALAATSYKLVINGKAQKEAAVVINGKTYVSVDALKASGVGVSLAGGTLSLALPGAPTAQGGANQNAAVEGCTGEWLFNGLWRFRATKVEPSSDPGGWKASVELRNGSKFDNIALSGTGWGGMQLILEDGTPVGAASDAVDVRDQAMLQGAGKALSIAFPSDDTAKTPKKLFLLLDPKGLAGTAMRYSVADPSFRVRLDCQK